jgi:Cu(I)/Ag(I) efflux system membrane protein CusA/SilA
MIERIIEQSIRNRFLVLIVAAGLTVWGIYAVLNTPIDAVPDLSENQVIVFTDWMGRSPKEIEDQVTYPLSLKLQGLAGVKAIRSSSEFNFSMITIIFENNVDFYFARQRVLEKLTLAGTFLPQGVVPYLAPDATAVGQIFWYTVEGGNLDPARLWALNKFYITPQLNSASGVAEVASVGGAPLEYQVDVRPEALRAYGLTLGDLYSAVARSNLSVGGRVIQKNNAEYLVRGVGWIKDKEDIENSVIKESEGTPIYVRNVAGVQLGTQFRRSVFEKNGNEVVGGVVMMRYGENPLAVTERVKEKIQQLQPGLPKGVRIVPAYDRTNLIHGAIDTLQEVMLHEMIIAFAAVLLILWHIRSALLICVTLPLAVLFSFFLMWLLRYLGIVDVQANIMSLAGITISIGILVDQAIVMTENATHHLKEHFGDRKVVGDTRELVIPACRTVGRPIFFSVMIMLISFIPVFALSGREGKLFHPLAFTKSFALVGVALVSVTVVPAMIPTFIRGRLRREDENWIVRSFINIYKPLLTWALPHRNLVNWAFAALLILAVGMFPLQAIIGLGASYRGWEWTFLAVMAIVIVLTVHRTQGLEWQLVSFLSLVALALVAYHFPKIGVSFMPALDEGSTLEMPVTVPRASITETADDLKARNALLRSFPEVELVVGKSGRADTPTDPAPLDMVETFVNYRPKELWPRRVLRFEDAAQQSRAALRALEEHGYLPSNLSAEQRDELTNDATQKALERYDEVMREFAALRYREFERELAPALTRYAIRNIVQRFHRAGDLYWPPKLDEANEIEHLAANLIPEHGDWLAHNPALEEVTRLSQAVARRLAEVKAVDDPVTVLTLRPPPVTSTLNLANFRNLTASASYYLQEAAEALGAVQQTFSAEVLKAVAAQRLKLWRERVKQIDRELIDKGASTYTWVALEELAKGATERHLLAEAPNKAVIEQFAVVTVQSQIGKDTNSEVVAPFAKLRADLEKPFAAGLTLWRRQAGPKGDLIDDEMNRVLQVPGWSNIFTQPILARIEMLSTGVRTDIGVKVFGPDLATIERVCTDIEEALKPVSGSRDVVAAPITGKGYLEITIDRQKAARFGISVADIQDTIEVALGGRVVTQTVEGRERFPVRIRYARAQREDEETVKRLLVSAAGSSSAMGGSSSVMATQAGGTAMANMPSGDAAHQAAPEHVARGKPPMQIPLGAVADVRIVEGPAMVKSENGRLLNYVTLNVRGRDMVGFVDEAQRVVAEKVTLPNGVSIEWSGEFEHQVRAARTLRFVLPVVILLIFLILYLTYQDLADASLMMMAVPEALAGGVFFQFLFPKILHGWSAPPLDFSVAVWVGYIACFGMATETGIIMLVYLREAIDKRGGLENIKSLEELQQAVIEGAVHRLRPKLLTEGVAIIALAPMLWASGVGGEIIAPMAVPVLGGLLIADEVVDIFLPVRFYWVRRARWLKLQEEKAAK